MDSPVFAWARQSRNPSGSRTTCQAIGRPHKWPNDHRHQRNMLRHAFQRAARAHSSRTMHAAARSLRRREGVLASRLGARTSRSITALPAKTCNFALTVARPRPATRGIAGLARATAGAPARAQVTWIGAARPVVTAYATREMSSGKKGGGGRIGAMFGLAALALGKFKYVLVGLKLTKLAPVLSMVASSLAYSAIFGPAYGCGMVGLIFVHECGHAIAMRYYGLPFSPMVFIPFVGAVIQMQKLPATAAQSAVVALAGPVLGGVAAGATAFAGHATGSQLLMALGDWGAGLRPSKNLRASSCSSHRLHDQPV